MIARDGRLPGSSSSRRAMRSRLARVVGQDDEVEQLRARLAPLASAQLGESLLDGGDRAHGRRHLRPSRASRSSAASGPQLPAA